MPLKEGKSQTSFEHNLKAELVAGKPKDQALAIAYAVKRKAQHKEKGGMVRSTRPGAMAIKAHAKHDEPVEGCSLCAGGMAR